MRSLPLCFAETSLNFDFLRLAFSVLYRPPPLLQPLPPGSREILRTADPFLQMKKEEPDRYLRLEHWLQKGAAIDPRDLYPAGSSKEKRRAEIANMLIPEVCMCACLCVSMGLGGGLGYCRGPRGARRGLRRFSCIVCHLRKRMYSWYVTREALELTTRWRLEKSSVISLLALNTFLVHHRGSQ